MYCPSCGLEERQLSQYCRGCGTDVRAVRNTLERTDSITASAVSAREQLGLAIADRIRELKTKDLEHFAEDVLPQIEKFLESPEEKRLRRVRAGVVTAGVGVGWSTIVFIIAMGDSNVLPMLGPGIIVFMIGLAVIINGLLFTVPKKELPAHIDDALGQRQFESLSNQHPAQLRAFTNELTPVGKTSPGSVTEHTTHHLGAKKT